MSFEFDFDELGDPQQELDELHRPISEEHFVGCWVYVGSKGRTEYRVTRDEAGQLLFDGPDARGDRLSGALHSTTEGFQAELVKSSSGTVAGIIDLRFDGERSTVISRFRVAGKDTWGKDITSHRSEGAQRPSLPPEPSVPAATIAQAEQRLSKPPAQGTANAQPQRPPPTVSHDFKQPGQGLTSAAAASKAPPQQQQPPLQQPQPAQFTVEDLKQPPKIHVLSEQSKDWAGKASQLSSEVFGFNVLRGQGGNVELGVTEVAILAVGAILVGFVMYGWEKQEAVLHYFAVRADLRKNGCAVALLKHVQERCRASGIWRMMAYTKWDTVGYYLRVGFYFAVQPPPNLHRPSNEDQARLHAVRFDVQRELGRPASMVWGEAPRQIENPEDSKDWDQMERLFFRTTRGKWVPEEMAKLRRPYSSMRVSVVVPTSERRQEFHAQLWACFEAQDWPDLELIVVETYTRFRSKVLEAKEGLPQFRLTYLHFLGEISVGMKRNMGARQASGRYIVHFDDDDLYAPGYVRTMIEHMRRLQCRALTLKSWYNCDTDTGEVSKTDPETFRYGCWGMEGITYGFGFSYVYLREVALEHPFPHVSVREDNIFMEGLRKLYGDEQVVLVPDDAGICLHLMHGANSCKCEVDIPTVPRVEAAKLAVTALPPHPACKDVNTKGMRALVSLTWTKQSMTRDTAWRFLDELIGFLENPSHKSQIDSWASVNAPDELHARVSDFLRTKAHPFVLARLRLPARSEIASEMLGSIEADYQNDRELVQMKRRIQGLLHRDGAARRATQRGR